MRVGEIIRVDPPADMQQQRLRGRNILEKVENITMLALQREHMRSNNGLPTTDTQYIVAFRSILARRKPGFILLLSIYRRTQKVYECHIQYTQHTSVAPSIAVVDVAGSVTFDLRLSDATIPIIQGAVGITVGGMSYRPIIDFIRADNHITFHNEPPENSEIDILFTCGGREMNVRGWWRSHRFEQEASERAAQRAASRTDRVIRDGTLFVNGQRVGEIHGATMQATQDVTQFRRGISRMEVGRHEQRAVPNNVTRGFDVSYEYLFQYNSALDPSDADELGALLANLLRSHDSHFVRLLSFNPIPENLTLQVHYQVDSPNAPITTLPPIGGVAQLETVPRTSATQAALLPDSRITIPREDKSNRITLEDEEIGYRRPDRSGIIE